MTSDDLERMRKAMAGMTPAPWVTRAEENEPNVVDSIGKRDFCFKIADSNLWRTCICMGWDNHDDLASIAILRNAHAIRQDRKWWCEWQPWADRWEVHHDTDNFSTAVVRDDGTPFTGPDSCTPLIEADAYFKERGR